MNTYLGDVAVLQSHLFSKLIPIDFNCLWQVLHEDDEEFAVARRQLELEAAGVGSGRVFVRHGWLLVVDACDGREAVWR